VRSYPKFKFGLIPICDSVSFRFGVGRFGLVLEHQNEIRSRSSARKTFGLIPILPKYDLVSFCSVSAIRSNCSSPSPVTQNNLVSVLNVRSRSNYAQKVIQSPSGAQKTFGLIPILPKMRFGHIPIGHSVSVIWSSCSPPPLLYMLAAISEIRHCGNV
jgi:hypothetical protein